MAPKGLALDGHFADRHHGRRGARSRSVEIVTTDAGRWRGDGRMVFELELDGTVVTTDNALVRFVAGASVGLASIDVAVRSPANVGKEVSGGRGPDADRRPAGAERGPGIEARPGAPDERSRDE